MYFLMGFTIQPFSLFFLKGASENSRIINCKLDHQIHILIYDICDIHIIFKFWIFAHNIKKTIQVCRSGELQPNYTDCVKLTKVKKIHNFMLNDFREIVSQHHNMALVPSLAWGPFCFCADLSSGRCALVRCNWFGVSAASHVPAFIALHSTL